MTSKYGNHRTVVDGYTFDSKAEARRYQELRLMEQAGEIRNLRVHPPYPLYCPGDDCEIVRVACYVADFDYWDVPGDRFVVEDVKGQRTAIYSLKRKWLRLQAGIEIQEIEA